MAETTLPEKAKIMILNAENLFIFLDKRTYEDLSQVDEKTWQSFTISLYENKPIEHVRTLARTILNEAPDILMITEVGGYESLDHFNQHFLENKYTVHWAPSNSDRGIDMGILIAVTMKGFTPELISHTNYPLPHHKIDRFSRDALLLKLSFGGTAWFHFFLVHLKSKLDKNGVDFQGRNRRSVEVRGLCEIIQKLDTSVPLFIGGDFNGQASGKKMDAEFLPLFHLLNLRDVAELGLLPLEERYSYIFFGNGQIFTQQLDYILINAASQKMLIPESVSFPRYLGPHGQFIPNPARFEQKTLQPSDHFPIVAEIDLKNHPLWSGKKD